MKDKTSTVRFVELFPLQAEDDLSVKLEKNIRVWVAHDGFSGKPPPSVKIGIKDPDLVPFNYEAKRK